MTAKALMLQGTGSDVGKSVLTAALCRIARRRGLSVAPFKPQNMSNNAAACPDGGEIGRAQALQALACGLAPHTDFNPVLLKPETDRRAQLVVQGKAVTAMDAAHYMAHRGELMDKVIESFSRLTASHDLVIVEGAGSPSEINLRDRDIANMGFARRAGVPVCLIGDIDRGGVIASLVGTQSVLDPEDQAMITGFLINKFRGDPALFEDGIRAIEQRTGWPCHGVIPWLPVSAELPAEDAVVLSRPDRSTGGALKISAPMLSRMANFDDADPLKHEPGVDFRWIPPGQHIPRDTDVIILFGTKSTLGDLAFLRQQGWDHDIIAHARSGGRVLGICGGYQMLGRRVVDPVGVDGVPGEAQGLGLLNVETLMQADKKVAPVSGDCAISTMTVLGYEIHTGRTTGEDTVRPMFNFDSEPDGARSADGKIEGTYLHGAFANDAFRSAWLTRAGGTADTHAIYSNTVERALDRLADGVEAKVNIDALLESAQPPGWQPARR
ncbi:MULTISPECIES: cobyric acid synthase [Hyphomonas]|uniref:Cobyric acid synthase n=1 Tax=Hyphomonas adhaerens TaxID=81029 RepID=A0A3B9GZU2_9PROT|nr:MULTISPECIES: cobyric acid synthase [Hyphomonas]MBB40661.1 cobyric acid synthase CobQ [Hyphomonas sp.]HAE27967.1 cobyric acid synthase CobQ [Hyphomonas adhaerens]|tara:strand:- start:1927 stop:3414 length:1488 start_codon:yes stop_codon:yes gene_type:complete